ncbi:hypothetical protein NS14008_18135 [Nocardia seriolae]|nr:hypothetical protein NS14008_18135 [Nocardia seriolae]
MTSSQGEAATVHDNTPNAKPKMSKGKKWGIGLAAFLGLAAIGSLLPDDKKETKAEAATEITTSTQPKVTKDAPYVITDNLSNAQGKHSGIKFEPVDILPALQQSGAAPADEITTNTRSVIDSGNWAIVAQCNTYTEGEPLKVGVIKVSEYQEQGKYNSTLLDLGLVGGDTGKDSPGRMFVDNFHAYALDCAA